MDIFRRLTNPTLQKLYRFVLKRLVGRFLDDDIALEQLDVQLRAGRIELTDLKINVQALAELLPDLPITLETAHVGRLRVEISYSKLLTDSLAFFLDDIVIQIAPLGRDTDGTSVPDTGSDGAAIQPQVTGALGADGPAKSRRTGAGGTAASRTGPAEPGFLDEEEHPSEAGDRLDFLAQWIEQITSKVKVVVNNLTVRIGSSVRLGCGDPEAHGGEKTPFLELRCSSLKWCDETPEVASFVPETPSLPQSAPVGVDRGEGVSKTAGGMVVARKRLTMGVMTAEWNGGPQGGKHDVVRVSGKGSVVIKHGRRSKLGSSPGDGVLDIDVSLRHADITLDADVCAGLCALSLAYLKNDGQPAATVPEDIPAVATRPVKALFREDFWYVDASSAAGNIGNGELNFDTLSDLLEQYADARARLAEAEGYGRGVFGSGSLLSLGQSDIFYDCEEGARDTSGAGGAAAGDTRVQTDQGSVKVRIRMTGVDVTLLLDKDKGPSPHSSDSASFVRFQMRRASHTFHRAGGRMSSVAEIGTFAADWNDVNARDNPCARVLEVMGEADSSPCIRISSSGEARDSRDETDRGDAEDIAVNVECCPVVAVLHVRLTGFLADFESRIKLQVRRTQQVDGTATGKSDGNGRLNPEADWSGRLKPAAAASRNVGSERRISVEVSLPKVTVRLPADPGTCSSAAYSALLASVESGTSPVGWTRRDAPGGGGGGRGAGWGGGGEGARGGRGAAPALVVDIEGAVLRVATGSPSTQGTTLECARVACEMLLVRGDCGNGSRARDIIGLYFLEASGPSTKDPLKVEYGLANNIGNARRLGVARPADAELNFLHTWEPNDGVDSGLGDVPPPVRFDGGLQCGDSDAIDGQESSPHVLLCDLPCLSVELSRLELVVLADILAGFAPPPEEMPVVGSSGDSSEKDEALPMELEVLLEARGATIVLHEAAAFAEDPGPHSFVLNLGDACLHLGRRDKSTEGCPAPLVTISSGDLCVHETLRHCRDDGEGGGGRGRITGPLLFLPGREWSAHPSMDDLPTLGFVPVLYQTKWAKGTSPVAAELALATSGPGAVYKTITATLNLYDVTLRHTVASSWLPRLLGLVVGDVPAGRAASANTCGTGVGGSNNGMGEASGNLTKMFITVFNGVVDYMPHSQSPGLLHTAPRKAEGAGGASCADLTPTEGRAVFPIGVLRVSSNMVAGAQMQGFKVVIRDIGLHMSNRVMDHCSDDASLCRGALEAQKGPPVSLTKTDFASVQEYLESSHFVQIATLNFLDAFLRTRSQVVVPRDAFTAVELWMGIVHVYSCQDSLSTCQALLGEWCALVNECRAVPAEVGKTGLSAPKRQTGQRAQDEAQDSGPKSLLDDVEQDAFLPGSNRESPAVIEAKTSPGGTAAIDRNGHQGAQPRESLVIEDYYSVSVEPPDAQLPTPSLLAEALDADSLQGPDDVDIVPSGQDSSFISEGEGPAQWLSAPSVGLVHGQNLAMESAENTSESEGEEEKAHVDESLIAGPAQPNVTRRSNFGFSLPAPIEIELEDRHDAETADTKESGKVDESKIAEPSSPSMVGDDSRSDGDESSGQEEECSSQQDSIFARLDAGELRHSTPRVSVAPTQGIQLGVDAPLEPETLVRRDSLPFDEREGAAVAERVAARGPPQAVHAGVSPKFNAPAKIEPAQGEQEARWLGLDRETPSDGSGVVDAGTSSHQREEFRVYPHYIPIPTTAEATSLPFLSGDPLVALGHGPGTNGGGEDGEAEAEGLGHKLQFQLAIHDLSICWRLFKGRDWTEKRASDDDRTSHQGSGESRSRSRVVARGSSSRAYVEGKAARPHRRRNDADTPSVSTAQGGLKPRKTELLDALLENYQDEQGGNGEVKVGRRSLRQPKVKLLKETGSTRSVKRTGRDTSCMLEVVLEHSSLRLDNYHPGPPPSLLSNLLFTVKNLHASDTLTSSRPRKTLQHWRDDAHHPREFQQKMVTARMTARSPSDHFCPEDTPLGDEIMLKVRLLPIHLSFGQHTVDFLRSFSSQAQPVSDARTKRSKGDDDKAAEAKAASPFFISCCDVGACKVKIDYQPRTLKVGALQQGDYLELLNLFPLEGVHLTLQKLLLSGVSGWGGVTQLLLQSWVQDITSNQLHKFLAGTTAVRPLVTVGKGVADLVLLPVEQYRRDGRVLRGLRKGTQSFLRAITIETLHTSHRVASFVARTLDDVVAQPGSHASLRGLEYYDEQPTGVLDSLEHAYDALAKEVQVAAQTIIAIPYQEQEEVIGPHGRSYVRSVARALPVAVLRPVVGASEALSCTLLGFRNYMSPVIRREEEGKWK